MRLASSAERSFRRRPSVNGCPEVVYHQADSLYPLGRDRLGGSASCVGELRLSALLLGHPHLFSWALEGGSKAPGARFGHSPPLTYSRSSRHDAVACLQLGGKRLKAPRPKQLAQGLSSSKQTLLVSVRIVGLLLVVEVSRISSILHTNWALCSGGITHCLRSGEA
jgi:hypothetical protein